MVQPILLDRLELLVVLRLLGLHSEAGKGGEGRRGRGRRRLLALLHDVILT